MKILPQILVCLLIWLFSSCAIQVAPGGGERDLVAPALLSSSPENYTTGFYGKRIELVFDEYIQLKDINNQLIISPPLKYFPDVKVKKKSLIVEFKDTLRASTTYSMNFGDAIVDNNEANILKNFQFVFSTGDVIDTLNITGTVLNALSRKAENEVKVILYKTEQDSVLYKDRPLYFSRTDDQGNFNIRNITTGMYSLRALKESNNNYLYDASDESVAFHDAPVAAGSEGHELILFSEQESFRLKKYYAEEPGKVVFTYSGAADTVFHKLITKDEQIGLKYKKFSANRDTITFWYTNLEADTMQFLSGNDRQPDTLTLRLFRQEGRSMAKRKFELQVRPVVSSGTFQDVHVPLAVRFNHPIMVWDSLMIKMEEDGNPGGKFQFAFRDTIKELLVLETKLKENSAYTVKMAAGAFTDIFGLKNDSLEFGFRTRSQSEYGTLAVNYTMKMDFRYPMLLQLVDDKEQLVVSTPVDRDSLITFTHLLPRQYRLRLVQDVNNNLRWDTGIYSKLIQPEQVRYYPEVIGVRANWDVEISWSDQQAFEEK